MIDYKDKFFKFGGARILDIIEYLKNYVKEHPYVTISVGCDSIQKRRKTIYSCTIVMRDSMLLNGSHVIFFRDHVSKIKDDFERLHKEAIYVHEVSEFLNSGLQGFFERKDLNDYERKRYKFHLLRCNNEYSYLEPYQEEGFIKNLNLSNFDRENKFKLVDIHVDFNPYEGSRNEKGIKNKSNIAYKSYVPWLRGLNYRVFAKPEAYSSTGCADMLLQY